jgi:hypothetical protein
MMSTKDAREEEGDSLFRDAIGLFVGELLSYFNSIWCIVPNLYWKTKKDRLICLTASVSSLLSPSSLMSIALMEQVLDLIEHIGSMYYYQVRRSRNLVKIFFCDI